MKNILRGGKEPCFFCDQLIWGISVLNVIMPSSKLFNHERRFAALFSTVRWMRRALVGSHDQMAGGKFRCSRSAIPTYSVERQSRGPLLSAESNPRATDFIRPTAHRLYTSIGLIVVDLLLLSDVFLAA